MLRLCVAVAPAESFTCTVKFEFPGAVGVPPIVAPLNESPAGSDPPLTDHVYPPVPPLAASPAEYADPAVPSGSEPVVTVNGGGFGAAFTLIVSGCGLELSPCLSVTSTLKCAVSCAAGVPLMVSPLNERPPGNWPDASDQEYGMPPPLAESVSSYASPTVASGRLMVVTCGCGAASPAAASARRSGMESLRVIAAS